MASPQHNDPGKQQSSTATGVTTHLDIPTGDDTTTLSSSVTTTPNPSVATDDATRRQRVNFADSIEYPQSKTALPRDFCSQCLACHPFRTKDRTHHIRSFKENLAMHTAIGLGKLPKVDPWAELVKAWKPPSPKPAPAQTQQQQGLAYKPTESTVLVLESYKEVMSRLDDPFEKVEVLNRFLDREDRAVERRQSALQEQQAPAAQQFGSYATAATTGGYNTHYPLPTEPRPRSPQPTGPPPKKRKAGNTNEPSGRADKRARFGGAHTTITQGAGGQRINAAQTPLSIPNPAPNAVQRQRASSNPLENVQRTSQTKSLRLTNVPTTTAPTKTPAKGDATAAKKATEQAAAEKAADDKAPANKPAPNNQSPT